MSIRTAPQSESQYSLVKILGIWALAAAPMAVLAWVVYAALVPDFASDLKRAGTILTALMMVAGPLTGLVYIAFLPVTFCVGLGFCFLRRNGEKLIARENNVHVSRRN